jgi:UDP-4-amino-4,6-dideoxy-N-acetyl-beta-L-altrosamine transaminase
VIPYGRHEITEEDIYSVTQVLQSDFLTQGTVVPKFEKLVADYCGAEHGIATNSATSALHTACLALGLKEGDYLWTTPITFVASANCGLYCGAKVDFVDIDPKTYNISVQVLEDKLIQAEKKNKLPKIVIPVHFAGQSCDMEKIYSLSQEYGFKIIEDASHAIGAKYKDEPVGNCQYSDITVFSFHPVKIITTGEGGMAVTNSQKLAKKMLLLRSHGITRDPELITHELDGDWYYQQIELGYNYRMNDIQAALGISQMQRLDQYVEKRHIIAKRYNKAFKKINIITPCQSRGNYSSYHLYVILLQDNISEHHKNLFTQLRKCGIGVNLHYIPVYKHPYYEVIGYNIENYLNSEQYYRRAMSLPIYPTLTTGDQDYVVEELSRCIKALE